MVTDHTTTAGEPLPYSALEPVLPLASLPDRALAVGAEAAALVRAADPGAVVGVGAVSTATGYKLAQMRPTAVRLDELPARAVEQLEAAAARDLSGVRVVVLGRVERQRNHALSEYA